ncbi:MAG: hypothetical protein KGL39_16415 [Patescibacteria group bacterium]|nr:hypothetical protein [Patescibacteria group bacterium]
MISFLGDTDGNHFRIANIQIQGISVMEAKFILNVMKDAEFNPSVGGTATTDEGQPADPPGDDEPDGEDGENNSPELH